jgi:hypothetical protein
MYCTLYSVQNEHGMTMDFATMCLDSSLDKAVFSSWTN